MKIVATKITVKFGTTATAYLSTSVNQLYSGYEPSALGVEYTRAVIPSLETGCFTTFIQFYPTAPPPMGIAAHEKKRQGHEKTKTIHSQTLGKLTRE